MASQAIKEYDDFAGQDGYVIVDGLNDQTPGGKKLLSTIGGSDGYTVYNLQPTNADLSTYGTGSSNNKIYVINAINKGLYFLDLSNITDSDFEYIWVKVPPNISADEYYDIMVQVTNPPTSDYSWKATRNVGGSDQLMDSNWTTIDAFNSRKEWFTDDCTECHVFGKHFIVNWMQSPASD